MRSVGGRISNNEAHVRAVLASTRNPFRNFVKHGSQIVLPSQTWEGYPDGGDQEDPKIVLWQGTYYMFYCAKQGAFSTMGIGLRTASAADYPLTWTPYAGNPILMGHTQTGVDDTLVAAPVPVQLLDGSWRLYYHAYGNGSGVLADRACVATCSALEFPYTWHKYDGNPIIDVSAGKWDSQFIHPEHVIPPWIAGDGLWHILYGACNETYGTNVGDWRGGHATSVDGLTGWTKDSRNPVFGKGNAGAFDSIGVHPVGQSVLVDGVFLIPYQGVNGTTWELGVVGTMDFVHYYRPANYAALVHRGTSGQWDDGSVENPGTVYSPTAGQVDWFYVASSYSWSGFRMGLARSTPAP